MTGRATDVAVTVPDTPAELLAGGGHPPEPPDRVPPVADQQPVPDQMVYLAVAEMAMLLVATGMATLLTALCARELGRRLGPLWRAS